VIQTPGKVRVAALAVAASAFFVAIAARSPGRDALRSIVQDQCVPNWQQKKDPSPCASVSVTEMPREFDGYAVLPDIRGGAHLLLIPVRTISGIESPQLLEPQAINYFFPAWQARERLTPILGHAAPRGDIGLAVNSRQHRSQDQLHIHIECLSPDTYAVLQRAADRLSDHEWTPITLAASQYSALRVLGEDLSATNPFVLLAQDVPDAREDMGSFTLLVAGMQFKAGPGFAVVIGRRVPGAESLLDPACLISERTAAH
jgi:CDP-diacylglycerol pyrophosphatase